jgi:glutathione S-transferase
VITLYDAARCPYCARVRIALAEKGIAYEPVEIDLSNRPAWLYEKNPAGRVPVLEEDTLILPESVVIMEYLEERYPEPALLPPDPAARGLERLRVLRFDEALGRDYYAFRRGDDNAMLDRLGAFDPPRYGFAAIAYLPWILRARDMLGVELPSHVAEWLDEISERPAVREELDVLAAL